MKIKYTIEELKSQLEAGNTIYDSLKDIFLSYDEWKVYIKKAMKSTQTKTRRLMRGSMILIS